MPQWLGRLIYMLRGKRLVRLHLADKPGQEVPSIEGIMLGRWNGHYVLLTPKLVVGKDQELALDGCVEVPAENVVFVQVIA